MLNKLKSNGSLAKSAFDALKNSRSPHSKFKVGAALLGSTGNIYIGTNVEFDAFTLTVCAERSALFNAIAHGEKNFTKLAIATNTDKFKFPCGLCRQALIEFNPELEIILFNKNKKSRKIILKELLPNFFKLK